jgi:hypothetical protein
MVGCFVGLLSVANEVGGENGVVAKGFADCLNGSDGDGCFAPNGANDLLTDASFLSLDESLVELEDEEYANNVASLVSGTCEFPPNGENDLLEEVLDGLSGALKPGSIGSRVEGPPKDDVGACGIDVVSARFEIEPDLGLGGTFAAASTPIGIVPEGLEDSAGFDG